MSAGGTTVGAGGTAVGAGGTAVGAGGTAVGARGTVVGAGPISAIAEASRGGRPKNCTGKLYKTTEASNMY